MILIAVIVRIMTIIVVTDDNDNSNVTGNYWQIDSSCNASNGNIVGNIWQK